MHEREKNKNVYLHQNGKVEMERSRDLVTQGHSTAAEKKTPTSSAMNGSSGNMWRGAWLHDGE